MRRLMIFLLLILTILSNNQQICIGDWTEETIGTTDFFADDEGNTATGETIGNTYFLNTSEGQSITCNQIGQTIFCN